MSDFGPELRRLMAARGIGVRELSRRVPCNPGYISQLRNDLKRPSQEIAGRIDMVLEADGALKALAARPESRRTGQGGTARPDQALRVRLGGFSPAQAQELIAHLNDQWHALVKTDNLLGPRHALGGVTVNLNVIDALLRVVRPPYRESVLALGARYAESAAWLYEDSADMAQAGYWTRRSMEWAVEGSDPLMVSWTLFRRSQHAVTEGDAAQALGLAAAARREAGAVPGLMLAAILQQEARAHALDGDESACHRALDQAHLMAAAADDPGDASAGHGSFCTRAYLEMQRGACWLTLGQPARAIPALETAVRSLPPAYRRDCGVGLGHQAAALADSEPDEAARLALEALDIARDSGSGRVMSMILPVAAGLAPHSQMEAVGRLRSAVAEMSAA